MGRSPQLEVETEGLEGKEPEKEERKPEGGTDEEKTLEDGK